MKRMPLAFRVQVAGLLHHGDAALLPRPNQLQIPPAMAPTAAELRLRTDKCVDRAAGACMSVWKQALHGAATARVPPSVYRKLRTKLCTGLRVDRAGRPPWLVASMLTTQPADPEFEVLLDRLRLCRQLVLSLPEWRSMLPTLWTPGHGKYPGGTGPY